MVKRVLGVVAGSVTVALAAALLLAGCAQESPVAPAPTANASAAPRPAPVAQPTPEPMLAPPTPATPAFDPSWQARFDQVSAVIAQSPGQLSVQLRDRQTGAVWQAGAVGDQIWTGSTIKLAMVTYLLEQSRAGAFTLTAADRADIADMLAWSSDEAADRIWDTYGGTLGDKMLPVFRTRYGMSNLSMDGDDQNWGALTCRVGDLANLMQYVLNTLDATDRAYVVQAMRSVDEIQHWGVWSVGPALEPGNKNGWLEDDYEDLSHWCVSTVGFVGPDQRYVLAIMYQMSDGHDSLELGAQTLSDISATLFNVATPAPAVIRPS